MDDAATRHERLRNAYLDARDALVDVLIERIGDAVRHHYLDAQYVEVDADRLEDGRFLLRPTGVRGGSEVTGPGGLAGGWQTLAPSLEPLLSELGEIAVPGELLEYIALR